jgi:hypothetical protein
VSGQLAAAVTFAFRRRLVRRGLFCRHRSGFSFRHGGSQLGAERCKFFLIEEEQLIRIELFTPTAERPLEKFVQTMFEVINLLLLLLDRAQELRT